MVYGAYGYTGRLIIAELKRVGINPVIAGRDEAKLSQLAKETELTFEVLDISDTSRFIRILKSTDILIHCAGPFVHTAEPVAEMCIGAECHYIDITGEYAVFEQLRALNEAAQKAKIMLLPGAGFDVVPSDCLAAHLASRLPGSDRLLLAFTSRGGGISRGTARTMVAGIPDGLVYRSEGILKKKPLGSATRITDFGNFKQLTVGISWGDISTAFFSTGIPNIEVYTGSTRGQVRFLKWAHRLRFLFKLGWVQQWLYSRIDKRPPGPGKEKREKARSFLYGEVSNTDNHCKQYLETPEGYTLTARSVVLITQKIMDGNFKVGYQTPSSAYGADLVLEIEGVNGWK
nr:saccharopine dehydrogenase NADP-binding domain-containing protein [Fulvivirga sedimenti]